MQDNERGRIMIKDLENSWQKLKKSVNKKAVLTMGLILICSSAGIIRANAQLPDELVSQNDVCGLSAESSIPEKVSYDNIISNEGSKSDGAGTDNNSNKEASTSKYKSSNTSEVIKEPELNLHTYTLDTLDYLLKEKDSLRSSVRITIITGKGLHSVDNNPLIKNKLIEYCKSNEVPSHVDSSNTGRIIIDPSVEGVQECSFVKRYNLLQKISQGNYDLIAQSDLGCEALIAWGKNPNFPNQEEALNAVINKLGDIENAAEDKQGQEALIALGKIPNVPNQKKALNTVINKLGGIQDTAQSELGREALIALGKIPNPKKQQEVLDIVIEKLGGIEKAAEDKQGREALIALGKIPNPKKQQEILDIVIKSLGGIKKAAEDKQGREALIAWGKIPNVPKQEDALNAVITALGGIEKAAENEQGRDALLSLGRIPNAHNQEEALNAVINKLGKSDNISECFKAAAKTKQGKIALNIYIKIPGTEYYDAAFDALNHDHQGHIYQPCKRVSSYEQEYQPCKRVPYYGQGYQSGKIVPSYEQGHQIVSTYGQGHQPGKSFPSYGQEYPVW